MSYINIEKKQIYNLHNLQGNFVFDKYIEKDVTVDINKTASNIIYITSRSAFNQKVLFNFSRFGLKLSPDRQKSIGTLFFFILLLPVYFL